MKLFHKKYIWVLTYDLLHERRHTTTLLINLIHLTPRRKNAEQRLSDLWVQMSFYFFDDEQIRTLKQTWL